MVGWTIKEEQLNVRFQRSIYLEVLQKSNCTESYPGFREESFCSYAKSDEIGLCVVRIPLSLDLDVIAANRNFD